MSNDRHLRNEGSGVKGSPTRARSSGNMCDMADWRDCTILIWDIGMRPRHGNDCAYRKIGEIAAFGLCRKLLWSEIKEQEFSNYYVDESVIFNPSERCLPCGREATIQADDEPNLDFGLPRCGKGRNFQDCWDLERCSFDAPAKAAMQCQMRKQRNFRIAEISERALLMHAEEVPSVANEGDATISLAQSSPWIARERFNLKEEISSIKVLEP